MDEMNRRRGRGRPPPRAANGLLVRAVVTAVYMPGDHPDPLARDRAVGVLCDCMAIGPRGFQGLLRQVPIMRQSGGYEDHEVWVPQPATEALSGKLDLDPVAGQPTAPEQSDGDHVLVGFLHDDLNLPVILGQLDHPSTTRKPAAADNYRLRRFVRGVEWAITEDGAAEFRTTESEEGITVASGKTISVTAADDISITGDAAVSIEAVSGVTITPGSGQSAVFTGGSGVVIEQGMTLRVGPGGGEQAVLLSPLLPLLISLAADVLACGAAIIPSPVPTPGAVAMVAYAGGWPAGVESTLVSAL